MSFESRGFTLVEVMVALLLMAFMSMLSWRALDSMVRTREALTIRGDQFDALRTLFAQWDSDCRELGPPDRWEAGLPLNFATNRIDLIRGRADARGVLQVVLVSYTWHDGMVDRAESPAVQTRSDLLKSWGSLKKGTLLTTLYDVNPVALIRQSTGLAGRGFMDGADWTDANDQLNQQWLTPGMQGNPLLTGLELSVGVQEGVAPLRKVCLTGQN